MPRFVARLGEAAVLAARDRDGELALAAFGVEWGGTGKPCGARLLPWCAGDGMKAADSEPGAAWPDRGRDDREAQQARRGLRDAQDDLVRALAELAAANGRASAFASQLEAALRRVAVLEAALAHAEAERDERDATLRETEEGLREARHETDRLVQSASWRVTRPLRALRRPGGLWTSLRLGQPTRHGRGEGGP